MRETNKGVYKKNLMEKKELNIINSKINKLVEDFCRVKFKGSKFIPGETLIPCTGKIIDSSEIKNMISASMDGWLTTGRFNTDFQNKLAKYLSVKKLITVNSGSSANLIAFSSLTSHLH